MKCIFRGCNRRVVAPYELYCKKHISSTPGKPIIELKDNECRAPVSVLFEDGQRTELFCGNKTYKDSSYCAYHWRIFIEK